MILRELWFESFRGGLHSGISRSIVELELQVAAKKYNSKYRKYNNRRKSALRHKDYRGRSMVETDLFLYGYRKRPSRERQDSLHVENLQQPPMSMGSMAYPTPPPHSMGVGKSAY
ncbi:unnamed protein product, partial [Owenia fusiformis]